MKASETKALANFKGGLSSGTYVLVCICLALFYSLGS